jgi:putative membrane protein
MKLITALATTCALLSAPAFAQSATTLRTTGATPTSPTISTPEFVNKAIESNMFDVRAARMAEQKGDSGDRSFARPEVLGHTKVTDDLKMMVNTGKVNAKIPSALDSDQQAKLDELGHLWGKSSTTPTAGTSVRVIRTRSACSSNMFRTETIPLSGNGQQRCCPS